jgi:hypothetical protein
MKLKTKHPYLLISILTIGIAVFISLVLFPTEPCIRITGMVLQLLGVGSVIVGIAETRQLFGEPSFYSIAKNRVLSLLHKRNIIIHTKTGNINFTSSSPRISQRNSPVGDNPTIKERVYSIEKNISLINTDLKNLQEEMDILSSEIHKRINEKTESIQNEITEIDQKLKESATGGIHISALGASWLFLGVVLSSLAPEIAKWIS